ncbi:two-component sensor histidine kinase [Bradyrhizobium sp. SSBR45G]|uniref:ATP-binding protein n=1 Tax=unclassified Bradyrhizobium TaxID=2631580 RepID=UPI002342B1C6|nr:MULTISPECIES: ATP-binding protein [unclassified Bradyrhizobium]GLH82152.1 two-component sensor histidine kinase [Bradyrhizobium sp. SSBR45G]GLH89561.1 two-component sensor histidine kinase [Bradyrhizobium sp. SSBR45R]
MLGRLGFAGRLMAIVLFALIALWAVGLGWLFLSESREDIFRRLFPVPEQVSAIVQLIESAGPADRPLVLKAVSSERLQVTLTQERPEASAEAVRRPLAEQFLTLYLQSLQPRDVIVLRPRAGLPRWRDWHIGDNWRNVGRSVRFAVSLRDHGYLVFEASGVTGRRLLGLPPGFGVGLLGALIGMAAVIAIAREARPLRQLSQSLGQFSSDATAVHVKPAGAPEIRRLITAVNDMQTRISELVRGRTLLLGAVSHDLKTYITRLRLRVERLPEEEQRDKAAADLDEMTRLLEDALAVSRGGFAAIQRQPVDLKALLAEIVEDRRQSGARIQAELGHGPLNVLAEPTALRRLFINLIENALRFATRCTVRQLPGREVVIAIDDDGPGIPPDARNAVFEPFFRLDNSRSRSTGGSGLGLAIVKQIADAHGASLDLSTSPEGGLRMRIAFPSDASVR